MLIAQTHAVPGEEGSHWLNCDRVRQTEAGFRRILARSLGRGGFIVPCFFCFIEAKRCPTIERMANCQQTPFS